MCLKQAFNKQVEILNSSHWFEILEKAIQQALNESTDQGLDSVYMFNPEESQSSVLINKRSVDDKQFEVFDQSWAFLNQILTNELQINQWRTLTITGRSQALTVKSLAPIPNSILLSFIHEISVDINEFMQLILNNFFDGSIISLFILSQSLVKHHFFYRKPIPLQ